MLLKWCSRVFDTLGGPRLFEIIWGVFTTTSVLSKFETQAASSVFGVAAVRYSSIRVAEGGLLWLILKLNGQRAFTTFHTINFPKTGGHSRANLDIVVHEITHVCQFETVGSVYIWQALRAQRTTGYAYGGWQSLQQDWSTGKHFRDYNREQQGSIAQDFYKEVISKGLPADSPVCQAYGPFIGELRNREL